MTDAFPGLLVLTHRDALTWMVDDCESLDPQPIVPWSSFTSLNYRELPTSIWRGFCGQLRGHRERRINKLTNAPRLVRNAQRLRWRRAQGFVSAPKFTAGELRRSVRNRA